MLTKRQVDALRYNPAGPQQQILWGGGGDVPGFGCRVYLSGRKSFVLSYRAGRRTRMYVIGEYGPFTVQQARAEAEALRVAVRSGDDPAEERRTRRDAMTVAEWFEVFDAEHLPTLKTGHEHRRRLRKWVLPRWGSRRLEDVSATDVRRLHSEIGRRAPYEANRVLALVSVFYSQAIEHDDVKLPDGFGNPAAGVKPNGRERERERWVDSDAELLALLDAIEAEPNAFYRAYFRLLLLTGCRKNELLRLQWSDVRLDRAEAVLRDTKSGEDDVQPLPTEAVEILRTLPRFVGNAFVFPSLTKPGEPMRYVRRSWDRVRARTWLAQHPDQAAELRKLAERDVARGKKHAAKGPDAVDARLVALALATIPTDRVLRLHDLRRTFGSRLANSGASLPQIAEALRHKSLSETSIYARISQEANRRWIEQQAASLSGVRPLVWRQAP
jgi:integrase